MRVLYVTSEWPTETYPWYAPFLVRQVEALRRAGVDVSSSHTPTNGSFRFGPPALVAIRVGKGAWLGAHVVVAGGAYIGSGTLVAAGAVVTGMLEDNVLAAGLSAKPVRALSDASLQPDNSEKSL